MTEDTEAALMHAGHQIEQLQREVKILRAERDSARAALDSACQQLSGIHALLYPRPITTADGKQRVFAPDESFANQILYELSARIRAVPEQMEKLGISEARRAGKMPTWHDQHTPKS